MARGRRGGRRHGREARRGRSRRLSARELRAERKRIAKGQAGALKLLERKLHRPLTKRERTAELRRIELRHRRDLEAARRRAEAARLAAIARQQALRDETQALIGRDDARGEDPEVRRVAVSALGNHAGTIVVMDPKTGRVYTVVNQEWALRRGFKPCSTIKLVTGVAGLCEKVIEPVDTTEVGGNYKIDLTDALAYSNNYYFQQVGGRVGFDKMITYARELGLGEKTGINAANEFPGRLPAPKTGFALNRMCSHGDDFEITAVQLAALVSAMANGGTLLVPHTPQNAKEEAKFKTVVRRQLNVDQDAWHRMVPGMVGAVNYGSGKRAYDPLQTVAGKTGTCIGQGGWLGLFTSYAPLANPRLAVVVIGRGADGRGHFPAAVAGQIYRELSKRFGTPANLQIAVTPNPSETGGRADAKAEALNDEAKDEAAIDAAADDAARAADGLSAAAPGEEKAAPNPTAAETVTPRNTLKRVLMPIPRHPEDTFQQPPKSGTPKSASPTGPQTEQRPRRALGSQP